MQINILKLDETEYWSEEIRAKAGRLLGVYLYCPSVVVHCCELTPSYELHYMGVVIAGGFTHSMKTWTGAETEREDFIDVLREAIADSEDVRYMHCSVVDAFAGGFVKLKDRSELAVGATVFGDFDGETPEEAMEAAAEYLRGNGFVDT